MMNKQIVVALALPALLSSCIPWQETSTPSAPTAQGAAPEATRAERHLAAENLERARDLLEKGDSAGATNLLAAVAKAKPVAGVTDEALFRLALLSLRPAAEKGTSQQAHLLFRRLNKEYPASIWTAQAAPVGELLNAAEELRRQNRNLKNGNQSLSAERDALKGKVDELDGKVRQLNKNLDQLKHLDRELERKAR